MNGVESRLKESAKEFEGLRRQAKECRDKFLSVKKRRLDLFQRAFNHISDQIDRIYKELTKSRTHPLGGTAYLTLENNEVRLIILCLLSYLNLSLIISLLCLYLILISILTCLITYNLLGTLFGWSKVSYYAANEAF